MPEQKTYGLCPMSFNDPMGPTPCAKACAAWRWKTKWWRFGRPQYPYCAAFDMWLEEK